ncbi:flagellar motor switch protein FliM [Acidobacteria bacterium AB60]|nr:flagellar motor switch protein FliM [Acidobacteria bacterium AB60]
MSVLSQEEIDAMVKAARRGAAQAGGVKPRSVYTCNFRSAGRLSNENARSLTALHETFARNLTSVLDAYLGANLEVKLLSLDQLSIEDYISAMSPSSYIVPCSLSTMESTMIMELDIGLVFPIIDLLAGGSGADLRGPRELSEIDEEIMQSVTSQIARQVERAWQPLDVSLTVSHCVKSSVVHQYFPPNEKALLLMFEIDVTGTTGPFNIILPMSFASILTRQAKAEQMRKRGRVRFFPRANIRERILDCDVLVSADVPNTRVRVSDLVRLEPGQILRLRAPVKEAGMLTVEGHDLFQAVPVRNGSQKAAQLGQRIQRPAWTKE